MEIFSLARNKQRETDRKGEKQTENWQKWRETDKNAQKCPETDRNRQRGERKKTLEIARREDRHTHRRTLQFIDWIGLVANSVKISFSDVNKQSRDMVMFIMFNIQEISC